MTTFNPNLSVPEEISRKAKELSVWMEIHNAQSVCGIGHVFTLERRAVALEHELANTNACLQARNTALAGCTAELEAAKREIATLRALVRFADARINHGLERRAHPRSPQ